MYRIGDFLIQIKNAYRAGKKQVDYPHSKVAESIGKILVKENYIKKISVNEDKETKRKTLVIELKYDGRVPAMTDVKLVSKPSVHQFVRKNRLGRAVSSHGMAIVSTSSGIMTNRDAAKAGVGGELICQIY